MHPSVIGVQVQQTQVVNDLVRADPTPIGELSGLVQWGGVHPGGRDGDAIGRDVAAGVASRETGAREHGQNHVQLREVDLVICQRNCVHRRTDPQLLRSL